MTNDATKKYDPGLAHLRLVLRTLIGKQGFTDMIQVNDGESGWEKFPITEEGVIKASEIAADIDGFVSYRVGDAVVKVIYDGPYSEANAAEIVNDMNALADQLTEGLSL